MRINRIILIIIFSVSSTQFAQWKENVPNHLIRFDYYSNYGVNYYSPFSKPPGIVVRSHYSLINLCGQALVGTGLSTLFTFTSFGFGMVAALGRENEITLPIATMLFAFSFPFGAALGVHWVASAENPNLSLWKTFGSAAIGAGISVMSWLILSIQYTTIPAVGGTITAMFPVIASMLYASFVADWHGPASDQFSFYQVNHKDVFQMSQEINITILRLRL